MDSNKKNLKQGATLKKLKRFLKQYRAIYLIYGWVRYIVFRINVARLTLAESLGRTVEGELPLPPPLLRYRVHGALDQKSFLATGSKCASDIKSILKSEGNDLYSFGEVLDLACGCGRVLRHFQDHPANCKITGTDIDKEAIAWCRAALPTLASWDINDFVPPTAYPDRKFDFINVTSLFTHLNEKDQFLWLGELKRISRAGGLLLLSVHGRHAQQVLTPQEAVEVAKVGFLYKTGLTGRVKLDGLPDAYQTAFHSREYIDREWTKFFSVVRYVDRGINDHQDAVLLRNNR